jgi:hypothetical protein
MRRKGGGEHDLPLMPDALPSALITVGYFLAPTL